jgi:hypothetical protein
MGLRESTSPISEGMIQVDSLFICNVILLGGVGGRCCWRISAEQVWSRIGASLYEITSGNPQYSGI